MISDVELATQSEAAPYVHIVARKLNVCGITPTTVGFAHSEESTFR